MQTIVDVETARSVISSHLHQDFAFDLETSGLKPKIHDPVGVALTFSRDEASYYIVLRHTTERWDKTTFLETFISDQDAADVIRPLFSQRNVVMVAHNSKFDMRFLKKIGVFVEGRLFDTMNAAHILNENRSSGVGLKELARFNLNMELNEYKDLPHFSGFTKEEILGVPLPLVARYAMEDTLATWRLYLQFREELVTSEMEKPFNEIMMPLLPVLMEMEEVGVSLDIPKVKELHEKYTRKAVGFEKAIRDEGLKMVLSLDPIPTNFLRMATEEELEASYEDEEGNIITELDGQILPIVVPSARSKPRVATFNPASPKQLGQLLFEYHGLEVPPGFKLKRNADGSPSVDKDTLEVLDFSLGVDSPPILRNIVENRKASKFIGTYLDRFLEEADPDDFNSISTTFNQHITDTGRLSSSQPNLLNISARGEEGTDARSVFIARPGKKIIAADMAAFELRMLAHYSQDPVLMQAFIEGLDLHTLTGASQSNQTYEELLEKINNGDADAKKTRQIGKTSNFGLVYGMGAKKFQVYILVNNKIHLSIEECERLIKAFNENWKVANDWKQRVIKYAKRHGFVKTFGGRKRRLPDILSPDKYTMMRAERQAVNAVIQGSCGDVLARCMPAIQTSLAPLGGTLLLQIYDELVAEVPEEHAPLAVKLIETLMVGFANPHMRVPLVAEAGIGNSWLEAKS